MCQFKTTTVPVIVGVLGTQKERTDNHNNKIPGNPSQEKTERGHECPKLNLFWLLVGWSGFMAYKPLYVI